MRFDEMMKHILVKIYNFNKSLKYKKKIRHIANHLSVNNQNYNTQKLKDHKEKWGKLKKNVNPLWYKVYSEILQREEINFIPEDIYYTIVEPCLNNKQLLKAYADKNSYQSFYKKEIFPSSILRNIDGEFYTDSYKRVNITDGKLKNLIKSYDKLIIKPAVDSGGGHSVELFKQSRGEFFNKNSQELTLHYLKRHHQKNFLIQPYINQHHFFKQFNKESVNTVRIFTYRSVRNDQVIPLHSLLRVGRKGSHVDNQAAGGVSCGINKKGRLNQFAVDKYGNKFTDINGTNLNKEYMVPFYDKMLNIAYEIAPKHKYTRLLGFDFCVDCQNDIKLIEINNINNEINFYQMNNGPLFREYTDEVIDYCAQNKKSFVLDFYY